MQNKQTMTPEKIRELFAKARAEREAKAKAFLEKMKARAAEIKAEK